MIESHAIDLAEIIRIEEFLAVEPSWFRKENKKALNTWKMIGPFNVRELIYNGNITLQRRTG